MVKGSVLRGTALNWGWGGEICHERRGETGMNEAGNDEKEGGRSERQEPEVCDDDENKKR